MAHDVDLPIGQFKTQNLMSYKYLLKDDVRLSSFINAIMSTSFIGNISELFSNPVDNVISIKQYPFNVFRFMYGNNATPTIYNNLWINISSVSVENVHALDTLPPLKYVGGGYIPRYYNSFLDFAPYTNIELFLPFYGFITLDTNLVMGKWVEVYYAIDYENGTCDAFIETAASDVSTSPRTLIQMVNFKIAIDIPICGGGMRQIASAYLTGMSNAASLRSLLGGVVADAAAFSTGLQNVVGGLGARGANKGAFFLGAMGGDKTEVPPKGNVSEGFNKYYMPWNVYAIVTRADVFYPTGYNHLYGRPCAITSGIGNYIGYIEVGQVHLESQFFASALDEEKEEIERLLKAGVIVQDNPED